MTSSQWGHVGEKKKTPRTTGPGSSDGASEVDTLTPGDGDAADSDEAADGAVDGEESVSGAVDAGIGAAGWGAPAEGAAIASGCWAAVDVA
jgi:hypothetical protein